VESLSAAGFIKAQWKGALTGSTAAVNRAIELAPARGFRTSMLLPVSAPFHCALMKPAADKLSTVLDALQLADMLLPVVANASAMSNIDKGQVKPLLVTQVCAPVLWEQSVAEMVTLGVARFVEIGPGKVLSGLVKRISKEVETASVSDLDGLKAFQD